MAGDMSLSGIRRFYEGAEAGREGDGYTVTLDGKPVKTPAKALLVVPTLALAEALAEEWAAQEEWVRPSNMPLTRFACTAIDLVRPNREAVIDDAAAYGEHDLLCYRAPKPPKLVAQQQKAWQPLLDWAAVTHDAPLNVATGIVSVAQPEASLSALRQAIEALDALALTALRSAVSVSGSLIIGLALVERHIGSDEAFEAAELDESYQIVAWGEDAEAAKRREALRQELKMTERFLELAAR